MTAKQSNVMSWENFLMWARHRGVIGPCNCKRCRERHNKVTNVFLFPARRPSVRRRTAKA
jgi:hypothetical protein